MLKKTDGRTVLHKLLEEKRVTAHDIAHLKPVRFVKEMKKNSTMLDFTEQVPSTESPPELSVDTLTVSDSLPVTDVPLEDKSSTAIDLEQWNLRRTAELLAPYRNLMHTNGPGEGPIKEKNIDSN